MYIDRILAPIEALGPGKRLVIWTAGCTKHCKGCANPELWSTAGAKNISVSDIARIAENIKRNTDYTGITISGGDPLEQREEILELLGKLKKIAGDILVYTGYVLEDIEKEWSAEEVERLKTTVTVLIDGPYIEDLNTPEAVLRGSANQRLIFFDRQYEKAYEAYMKEGRKIQNVYMGSRLVSVGIHNRGGEQ